MVSYFSSYRSISESFPQSALKTYTVFLFQRIDQVNLPTEMSKIREET